MSNNPGRKLSPQPRQIQRAEGMGLRGFILSILPAILIGLVMWFYSDVDQHPSLPNIDAEKWWGVYPIDMESYETIRPYSIEFADPIVDDLKVRLLHRRPFAHPLQETGSKYGFNSYFLTRILDFWQNSYNFKEREDYLNKYNQYITNIQGLNIHYIHVQPETPPDVVKIPILLLHGWPSSIREFYDVIPLLTSHRTNQNFVFEVIAPSLPGYGFSEAPAREGMGPLDIAVILNNLMKRIGHNKYYVHGSSFGNAIGSVMATVFPQNVYGFHFNTPSNYFKVETNGIVYKILDAIWPKNTTDNKYPSIEHKSLLEVSGYYQYYLQPTKPDTIGISLSESPAGLAAYILEKFASSPDNLKAADGGLLKKYSLTHLLDNVMIYWVTNSITSTMRHYMEYYSDMVVIDQIPSNVPTWNIKFKQNIHFTSEDSLKTKYPNLLGSTVVEDAAQFPAMENPKILVDDIYNVVATFRRFNSQQEQPQSSPKTTETEPKKHPESEKTDKQQKPKTVYDFTVKDIQGHEVNLEKYRGKVLIIVNVASQCGYTDTHYTQLNELYEKYSNKGLRILAFPCNQFGGQEPGNPMDIIQFTRKRNVKFDLFDKIEVNGENTHPLWNFLKNTQRGTLGDFIKWNFSKFIIDRNGIPVGRYGPNVNPIDLEPYLANYW